MGTCSSGNQSFWDNKVHAVFKSIVIEKEDEQKTIKIICTTITNQRRSSEGGNLLMKSTRQTILVKI
jgi:hypothetical protein